MYQLYPKLKNPANPFVGEGQKSVLKSWVITLLIKTIPNFKKSASLIPRKNEKNRGGGRPNLGVSRWGGAEERKVMW